MSVRRGSLKLKALGRSHGPLHILLWQAREAQSTLLAAAAAQKNLFSDLAAWASTENRALSDVCSSASELSSMYSGAMTQLALAFKSFRKEMGLVLEGEKRCDNSQKRLQDAEQKRIKLRRQVLRAQNRTISEGTRQSGDFTQLQTQLAEAERTAERAHIEACEASREQEAVKLVVLKTALTKLSQSHLTMSSQVKVIFEGNSELSDLLPDPPPPGDPLSCIRYTSYDTSKAIVDRVKRQANIDSGGGGLNSSRRSSGGSNRPLSTSTPVTSPNSSMWSPEPSAPYSPPEPPPPYNTSYLSSSPNSNQVLATHSRNSSINISNPSPRRLTINNQHVRSPNRSSANLENYYCNGNNLSLNSTSACNLTRQSFNSTDNYDAADENQAHQQLYPNPHRNSSSISVNHFGERSLNDTNGGVQRHSHAYLPNI